MWAIESFLAYPVIFPEASILEIQGRNSKWKRKVLPTWSIDSVHPQSNPSKLFCGYHKTDSKVPILKEKKKTVVMTLPDIKTYYKL